MKIVINDSGLDRFRDDGELLKALVTHFQYSIEDIESYDELTEQEQNLIPKETFDRIIGG